MKRLIITSMIALIALAGPTAMQLRADDTHHPEKAAKAKKASKTKAKQQKKRKPAEKASKSSQTQFDAKAQEL